MEKDYAYILGLVGIVAVVTFAAAFGTISLRGEAVNIGGAAYATTRNVQNSNYYFQPATGTYTVYNTSYENGTNCTWSQDNYDPFKYGYVTFTWISDTPASNECKGTIDCRQLDPYSCEQYGCFINSTNSSATNETNTTCYGTPSCTQINDSESCEDTPNCSWEQGASEYNTENYYDYCEGDYMYEYSCENNLKKTTYGKCSAGCAGGKCNQYKSYAIREPYLPQQTK